MLPRRHPEQSEGSLPQIYGKEISHQRYGIAKEETRSFATPQDDAIQRIYFKYLVNHLKLTERVIDSTRINPNKSCEPLYIVVRIFFDTRDKKFLP